MTSIYVPSPGPQSCRVVRDIVSMLDPNRGGIVHPYIHRILHERLANLEVPLSRCVHLFELQGPIEHKHSEDPTLSMAQSHDALFQKNFRSYEDGWDWIPPPNVVEGHARDGHHICPLLKDRLHFYGKIGTGTFGIVYAARDKRNINIHGKKHYAVKVTTHHTCRWSSETRCKPEMGKWSDGPREEMHYVPEEAIWMLFLRNSERFPAIDSVYTHGEVQAIVMSAAIDYDPKRDQVSMMTNKLRDYKAFTGKDLVEGKETDLDEEDVQKITSQIVEAWVYLLDMDAAHNDFGVQNFAVSENLDVTLLDFGQMYFAPSEGGFNQQVFHYVPFREYLIQPEFAIELEKPLFGVDFNSRFYPVIRGTWAIKRPHDVRSQYLWAIATVAFELFHGHCPWEEPGWDPDIDTIRHWNWHTQGNFRARVEKMKQRRMRIINEELPIDEGLNQDAVDLFRAMFEKDVNKRPTFPDLVTFLWLQGAWVDREGCFQCPDC